MAEEMIRDMHLFPLQFHPPPHWKYMLISVSFHPGRSDELCLGLIADDGLDMTCAPCGCLCRGLLGLPATVSFHLFRNKTLRSAVGVRGGEDRGRRDVSKWEFYWTGDVDWAETEGLDLRDGAS